jgi:heme-degrading monooxygenase HmoA
VFLHHVQFDVVPEKFAAWERYLPDYLATQARQPGGVSFRILKVVGKDFQYIALRQWLTKDAAERAQASPEVFEAGRPARENGYYAGPAAWAEYELFDMVWGVRGGSEFMKPGLYVQQVEGGVAPAKYATWRPYARNFLSVMARQPGVVGEEAFALRNDHHRFIFLRTFLSQQDANLTPEISPSAEVTLARKPAADMRLYEGGPGTHITNCSVYASVWGKEGPQACQRFMEGLKPT